MREAVIFSPSGHRLYVAQADGDAAGPRPLQRRPAGRDRAARPGQGASRAIEYGQWLLVQPADGDSAWVIDVGRGRADRAPSPTQVGDATCRRSPSPNTLLVRRGKDVVALDLAAKGFPETRPGQGRRRRRLAAVALAPGARCRGQAAADSSALAAGRTAASRAPSVYLQVSSSQNPAWANELAEKLGRPACPPRCWRRRGATRRTAWCWAPTPRASRRRKPAGRSACRRSSVGRATADHRADAAPHTHRQDAA